MTDCDYNGNPIRNVFIITGGTFCSRVGKYKVYYDDQPLGNLVEINSSSLATHFKGCGKIYDPNSFNFNPTLYNIDNDFPYEIDKSDKLGLKIITQMSSPCYPEINKKTGFLNKIRNLHHGIYEDNYVKITCCHDKIIVNIYNQDNQNLYKLDIRLSK